MGSINYGLLIKDNDRLIKQIEDFVSDSRFIKNDTSDDTENEFGPCDGFVSHGLTAIPVLCVESINKNLIVIETKKLTSWEKETIVEQTELLIDLYFDKLCKDEPEYGAFTAKQIVDRLAESYPNEYINTYIESTSFTKEYLLNILKKHSHFDEISTSSRSNDKIKNQMPFKIGLKFASGEAQTKFKELYKLGFSYVEITEKLGFHKSNRPYLSSTLTDNDNAKNIYKNKKIMLSIEMHCNENKIEMCQEFKDNLEKIRLKL